MEDQQVKELAKKRKNCHIDIESSTPSTSRKCSEPAHQDPISRLIKYVDEFKPFTQLTTLEKVKYVFSSLLMVISILIAVVFILFIIGCMLYYSAVKYILRLFVNL